ncbi:arginine/ornithine antiporter [Spiroplasma sabaudiense Ar-1343]|uniref:Arginine/ornithine antiporter n=1 Tax=Spiroplasma sabaudiense Ar-1343 TaxID=1276257 RepID=W6AA35_9MOLU|nr:YfcC family protein [Spiroplasma sabaudiense]AHI53922.1 arginine/ornithine antiporter [Spiroplasma sabaudiense Ar-1343]
MTSKEKKVSAEFEANKNSKPGKKFKFKMPTSFTILFFILLVVVIFTWIGSLSGWTYDLRRPIAWESDGSGNPIPNEWETITQNVKGTGLFDIFLAMTKGFVDKAEIIIFIICLGGFLNIVMRTKALEAFTQSITRKLGKNAIWVIPVLVTFFSFCGSTYGMAEETLGFYMIVIPLMIAAGFDSFTALMIVLFGAGTGVVASTVNPFLIGLAVDTSGVDQLTTSTGMAFRWISWIIFTLFTIGFIMWYANRVKKNPQKSVVFETAEKDKIFFLGESVEQVKFTKKRIGSLVVFLITFLIMILYLVGWDSIIGGTGAADAGEWFNKNVFFLSGLIPGFGEGGLAEVACFFIISSLIIALIDWKGEEDYVDGFIVGSKDMLGVCLVIAVAAGLSFIMSTSGLQTLIISGISSGLGGLNQISFVLISFLIFLPLSFLIPSTSGFATAIFPLWGPVAGGIGLGAASGSITAFSFASGTLNLFTPTSGVVMGALGIAKIEYSKLFKGAWIYILGTVLISIVLLSVGSLLPSPIF